MDAESKTARQEFLLDSADAKVASQAEHLVRYFTTSNPAHLRGMHVVLEGTSIRGVIESVILSYDGNLMLAVRIPGEEYAFVRHYSWWRKA